MKRVFTVVVALIALAGCGASSAESTPTSDPAAEKAKVGVTDIFYFTDQYGRKCTLAEGHHADVSLDCFIETPTTEGLVP